MTQYRFVRHFHRVLIRHQQQRFQMPQYAVRAPVLRELDRRALTSKSRAAAKEIADNNLGQATRTVEVSFTGVTVTVTGGTAATWIRVWIDGQPAPAVSVSGTIVAPGSRLVFSGEKRVEIRSGDPAALLYTLNGRSISTIGGGTGAETYAFLVTGQVQKSSRR